jgi:hypothetical protein
LVTKQIDHGIACVDDKWVSDQTGQCATVDDVVCDCSQTVTQPQIPPEPQIELPTQTTSTGPLTPERALDWDPSLDCKANRVSLGAEHVCAITTGRHLFCWGANYYHQIGRRGGDGMCGDPATPCITSPDPVAGIQDVVGVALGTANTCTLHADHSVKCWGTDQGGELGTRVSETCPNPWAQDTNQQAPPCTPDPQVVPGVSGATDIDAWGWTCVALPSGVKCWGGEGKVIPTPIANLPNAIAVEDGCALDVGGKPWCWDHDFAALQLPWDGVAVQLTKGYNNGCVIDGNGQLFCWGLDRTWASGVQNCDVQGACTPTPVASVQNVAQASGSSGVTWLRTTNGEVRSLTNAQLGTPVALPSAAIDISGGYFGACAVLDDGRVYCWANDDSGDLEPYLGLGSQPTEFDLCVLFSRSTSADAGPRGAAADASSDAVP